MRGFPAGRQTFKGVPFNILSPRSCLVLKNDHYRPQSKDLPERVVIPIKRKADVLVFLHSAAYLGNGHCASYLVRRADGTQEEIKVIGENNLRDWSDDEPDRPFKKEFPTTSQAAWTGSNATFDKVSAYMMTWVNTAASDVTEVEMSAAGKGVPILIAITAGVRAER
jgi:hypothetical protein